MKQVAVHARVLGAADLFCWHEGHSLLP